MTGGATCAATAILENEMHVNRGVTGLAKKIGERLLRHSNRCAFHNLACNALRSPETSSEYSVIYKSTRNMQRRGWTWTRTTAREIQVSIVSIILLRPLIPRLLRKPERAYSKRSCQHHPTGLSHYYGRSLCSSLVRLHNGAPQ